jgi:hypothetical protein
MIIVHHKVVRIQVFLDRPVSMASAADGAQDISPNGADTGVRARSPVRRLTCPIPA